MAHYESPHLDLLFSPPKIKILLRNLNSTVLELKGLTPQLLKSRQQKFSSANLKKKSKTKLYHIDNSKTKGQVKIWMKWLIMGNLIKILCYLQIQLFLSLIVKE